MRIQVEVTLTRQKSEQKWVNAKMVDSDCMKDHRITSLSEQAINVLSSLMNTT